MIKKESVTYQCEWCGELMTVTKDENLEKYVHICDGKIATNYLRLNGVNIHYVSQKRKKKKTFKTP